MKLGVNIDHIAVLREARKINDPDPLEALPILKRCGAHQVTIHLREDRRHIHDEDVAAVMACSQLPVNLECSLNPAIIDAVCRFRPHRATLVPENREEVTTEGGLDILKYENRLMQAIAQLNESEIEVSLFVDPMLDIVKHCDRLGAGWVEFHTGAYSNIYTMLYSNLAKTHHSLKALELPRHTLTTKLNESIGQLRESGDYARALGLHVAAGHGLNYQNVAAVAAIDSVEELNIGQSIIARSLFTGLEKAILDMKALLE